MQAWMNDSTSASWGPAFGSPPQHGVYNAKDIRSEARSYLKKLLPTAAFPPTLWWVVKEVAASLDVRKRAN